MDLGFPELNGDEGFPEYTISKSKPTNLHLARMPDNFKVTLDNDNAHENTQLNRNLVVKKQKINESDSKETYQFVMEDFDEVKKNEDNHPTRYIGKEVIQNQKFLVFYRKEKDIMLCGLSSTISFKKDQHLKSSTLDSIKGKKGGRQQGVKAMLKASANKKEEEKEKERAKDGEGNDDEMSGKSWSDSDDSDSDAGQKGKGRKKKGEKQMVIKDIFEPEVPEPPKKVAPKEAEPANKVTPQAANEEEGSDAKSSGNDKDSDDDSNSSFDFE
jgi:hypothetical protein